jgi:hypothetical protein
VGNSSQAKRPRLEAEALLAAPSAQSESSDETTDDSNDDKDEDISAGEDSYDDPDYRRQNNEQLKE